MSRVIKSGTELDWTLVRNAADAIRKQAEDAGYTPPEAVDIHQVRIGRVCVALDTIVDALKIERKTDESLRAEIKQLRAERDQLLVEIQGMRRRATAVRS